ncbi:hypothetical protein OG906_43370 (plasmid) [Streptomyces sp. NBC_01426]|jgi:hypothetical protein|uniref:hypothetical protein n=1 Tax=Streptomyces TaxID=1883 RepID=UPI001BAEA537|nr:MULTISPECIES: hypothetical protein [Streptomyces]QUW85403.1 hypothetical protein SMIR_40645 [Streptomyces mirabilis]
MTTDTNHPDAETAQTPTAAPAWRLWILLVWHPALGLPVDPVAVLGLDEGQQQAAPVVRWVPLVYEAADPWRERLSAPTTSQDIERWIAQSGGVCAIEPADVPDGALDLTHAADLVLDELLAEVIPALPPRGDG